MVGHEFVTKWTRQFSAGATQFPNDEIGLADLSLGTPSTPTSNEIMTTNYFLSLPA